MEDLFVDASVAILLTSIFAFRFRTWGSPGLLTAYFAVFFALEWVAKRMFILPGTVGPELAYVCLGIAFLFVIAGRALERYERKQAELE